MYGISYWETYPQSPFQIFPKIAELGPAFTFRQRQDRRFLHTTQHFFKHKLVISPQPQLSVRTVSVSTSLDSPLHVISFPDRTLKYKAARQNPELKAKIRRASLKFIDATSKLRAKKCCFCSVSDNLAEINCASCTVKCSLMQSYWYVENIWWLLCISCQ